MRALVLVVPLAGCMLLRGGEGAHCPDDRTVVLALQDEVAAFAGCKRASGVIIRTGATLDLSPLRELEEIAGDLVLGPTVGVDDALLYNLRRVGGTIHVANNGSLHGLFLPRLEEAGRIEIDGNAALATISLPRLARVAGAVVITDNHALELVDAAALVTVGKELVIASHPRLSMLELGRLAHAEALRLEADPMVPSEVIDAVRARIAGP